MTYEELRAAIDGLYAYDQGATSSGIHDEHLRAKVKAHIKALPDLEHRAFLARLVIDLSLSTEALAAGYGPEDALAILEWIDNNDMLVS